MNIREIIRINPQVTEAKYGAEPSIEAMMMHYYTSHGVSTLKASGFVEDYIKALEKAVGEK